MPDNPDDEAVRIFVEFDRIDSAIKGMYYLWKQNFWIVVYIY